MMDLREAVSTYLEHLKERQSSQAHLKTVEWRLSQFLEGREDREVGDITRSELAEHFIELARTRADGTMAGLTSTHKAFWSFAEAEGWTEINVGARLKRFSYKPKSRRAAPAADIRKVALALPAYADHRGGRPRDVRDALFVSLSLDSGARLGAMAGLERRDVAAALKRPARAANGRLVYQVVSRRGKTGTSKMEFCEETAQMFRRWLKMIPATKFVFVNINTGEPLRRDSLARAFERVCAYADVPVFRSHAVRKRNVSQILASDPQTAQRYADHSSLETTYRHYSDVDEDDVLEATASLAERWRGVDAHEELRRLFGLQK